MLFDNRILDVKRWKNVHPGSKEAIVNHLKEDISKLFDISNTVNYLGLRYIVYK